MELETLLPYIWGIAWRLALALLSAKIFLPEVLIAIGYYKNADARWKEKLPQFGNRRKEPAWIWRQPCFRQLRHLWYFRKLIRALKFFDHNEAAEADKWTLYGMFRGWR